MNHLSFRKISIILLLFTVLPLFGGDTLDEMKKKFQNPPRDCWPHTRWWWPGNPVSLEEITWELEQMHKVGIRGVEQITMAPVYEKGNISYLSDEFMEMVKHTVKEARRLDMEVSFNFGGPFWIIGGAWVPEEDKSKDMIPTFIDLTGPDHFIGPLPDKLIKTQRSWEIYKQKLSGNEKLLAVVAGKVVDHKIDDNSLTIVTTKVEDGIIDWQVPEGKWRLMAFWLATNDAHDAVDHFNKAAMDRYCNYLGTKFKTIIGDEFGKTVDSFFCDSFELPSLASGIKWSAGLLEKFKKIKGYDLLPYLPAIWWDVGEISPKIRYDVNDFLNQVGLDSFFSTFLNWCEANGIKGRIQPYGFETDILKSAGMTHIPEMEITPGEKGQHPWFDTRIGPKKYVASGAHIYGRNTVSVEAFTFLHWERYRATLEEIKIAADGFLRSGATKFYNHGFSFLPERDLAPSRRMPWAPQINPTNVWWKYYPKLTEYIARCSYVLRQGSFAPDIAIYSPLANQWTLNALNSRKWTRDFDWDQLGNLLISNGYDFDLLNDDALQNIAGFENGMIKIRDMEYKILLLPNIESMPLKTLKTIKKYAREGGIVIALDRVPAYSTGLTDYQNKDKELLALIREMFKEPVGRDIVSMLRYGKGKTHYIKNVINRKIWWDQFSSIQDPFIDTIKQYVLPDFGIDFAYEGIRKNKGLTFLHRKLSNADIYFITNIQDQPSTIPVNFRVINRTVWEWNPYSAKITQLFHYKENEKSIEVPLNLKPYESTILVFEKDKSIDHVYDTNLSEVYKVNNNFVSGIAEQNGVYHLNLNRNGRSVSKTIMVSDIPSHFVISGNWNMILESEYFGRVERNISFLKSWTDDPETRHFSGTAKYTIEFELPEEYIQKEISLLFDPGKLGNVAEIILNDNQAGIIWMRGQTIDVTQFLRVGKNDLIIFVTNTNINRVSSFKDVQPVPEHLSPRFGPARKMEPNRLPREFGFKPLPASGVIGPVKLIPQKKIRISLN